jgi:hypothetical protein
MKLSRALIGFFLLTCAIGATAQNRIYRNREFGIVLPVPSGTLPCIPPFYQGNGVDHGPQIILGTKDASLCTKSSGKRHVDVWGSFTTTEEEKTLRSLLDSECKYVPNDENDPSAVCSPAPAGLSVNGLPSLAGRINHSNGWIEIIVVTQAGKPAPDFDSTVPSRSYSLSLYTDANHLNEDLAVFRAILKTIKITR